MAQQKIRSVWQVALKRLSGPALIFAFAGAGLSFAGIFCVCNKASAIFGDWHIGTTMSSNEHPPFFGVLAGKQCDHGPRAMTQINW